MSVGVRARRAPRTMGLLASTALATTGVLTATGPAGAQASTPASPAAAAAACGMPAADARMRAGYGADDLSSMTHEQSRAWDAALQQQVQRRGLAAKAAASRFTTITIDVRVHVITRSNGTGGVKPKQVHDQIKVLNQAYRGESSDASTYTPFRFRVKSYDVTANTDWYNWTPKDDDKPAKQALHKGGYDDLNMYVASLSGGLLGYAYSPQSQIGYRDGVVLLGDSLPGGSAAPYNEGDTATHEIGHWLGLAHTFQNGCDQPGDFVDDTPYQDDGNNIFFCRESDNTCPQPGKDPVHNFMSYGDDPCLDRFTPGQGYRMLLSWLAYRDPS